MEGLFDDWKGRDTIVVDHCHNITLKVCFLLAIPRFVPYFRFDRLHFSLSELQVYAYLFTFFLSLTYFSKDLEKAFCGKRKT